MGDGLIAYFPEPSFITMNDLAIDCALTMRGCVYRAINPVLLNHGLPKLDVRIGLDAGEAFIVTMGNPKDKQHKDIIGAVVSLATKIQSLAQKGGINLGEVVHRHLHVAWRQVCEAISVPSDWPYEKKPGEPYIVYRVTMK